MPVLTVSDATIERAAKELQAGRLVAFPTETVYGLGADATNGRAVAQIFEAKGRPRFNPLIVHVAGLRAAERIARMSANARRLARVFWPGPLTLVLERRSDAGISDLVTAGLETVAIRVPDHPVALALLRAAGVPVAAPSANLSGHVSPTTAAHVAGDLGNKPAVILDGGPTLHGLESTVLLASGPRIAMLRPGALTREDIETVLAEPILSLGEAGQSMTNDRRPQSPGLLASHYAPRTPVRLNVERPEPGEVLLAFGPEPSGLESQSVNISPSGDLVEAASNLFAALRELDAAGARAIAVMSVPETGLGEAINDRLRRAAAGRT